MKIRSSLEVKQKSGEFVGSFAPYGYMKSPENKNQLIVDEAVSEYVQMIFPCTRTASPSDVLQSV